MHLQGGAEERLNYHLKTQETSRSGVTTVPTRALAAAPWPVTRSATKASDDTTTPDWHEYSRVHRLEKPVGVPNNGEFDAYFLFSVVRDLDHVSLRGGEFILLLKSECYITLSDTSSPLKRDVKKSTLSAALLCGRHALLILL